MKIYIIRHAHALHNVNQDYSIYDPAITNEGYEQCFETRKYFEDVEMVISSTAVRTLQTASAIFYDKKIYATDLLLEYNTGIPCNSRNELSEQKKWFPHVDFDAYKVSPLEIENTWQDGDNRANKFLTLLNLLDCKVVAIVSHCNFILNLAPILGYTGNANLKNCDYLKFER